MLKGVTFPEWSEDPGGKLVDFLPEGGGAVRHNAYHGDATVQQAGRGATEDEATSSVVAAVLAGVKRVGAGERGSENGFASSSSVAPIQYK
ncbi:hypothetical protein NHQ30_000347 [Ciborinia camelliae]|nr:hypothetical protein NHQ30_000347 [Ciborinia camelliae]